MSHAFLERSALVVAHPDDEILWFSSVVEQVDEVILCFQDIGSYPEWSAGRRRMVTALPLPKVSSLEITESEVFDGADWQAPAITPYGLAVRKRDGLMPGFSEIKYRENFDTLVAELAERLRPYRNVITHNPWGEYGHEDHVQIHRAVTSLAPTLGFNVWYSNYCSNKSYPLMLRHVAGVEVECVSRPTNTALAERIKLLYQQHGCWTWFENYQWFASECLMRDRSIALDPAKSARSVPLNYIRLPGPVAERRQPHMVRNAVQRLRRAVGA